MGLTHTWFMEWTSGGTNLLAEKAGLTGSFGDPELRFERRNQPGAGGRIGGRFSARLPNRLYRSGTLESDQEGADSGIL